MAYLGFRKPTVLWALASNQGVISYYLVGFGLTGIPKSLSSFLNPAELQQSIPPIQPAGRSWDTRWVLTIHTVVETGVSVLGTTILIGESIPHNNTSDPLGYYITQTGITVYTCMPLLLYSKPTHTHTHTDTTLVKAYRPIITGPSHQPDRTRILRLNPSLHSSAHDFNTP